MFLEFFKKIFQGTIQKRVTQTGLMLGLLFAYNLPIQAETVLEEIQRTGVLKVGVRSDAIPFGYRDNNQELRGICLDFISSVREQLKKTIDRDIITIKLIISTLYNRFELVEDRIVHFECGPNTIRKVENYQIDFSDPFFITGTQLLIKKDLAKKLANNDNLSDIKIGLLRYTTTEKFIANKYPKAEFEFFQGVRGSLRAVQALQQGRIDAFANDGILLWGESILFDLSVGKDYQIVPEIPLTCEEYGLIIPKNEPSWRSFINLAINSAREQKILKEWFSLFNSDLKINQDACQKKIDTSI